MPAFRITGLVAASTRLRARLRAGLSPDDVAALTEEVRAIVRQVDALCADRGVTPGELPAPSRMAYRFLRELELAGPVPGGAAAPPPVRIGNVVRVGEQVAGRLWHHLAALAPASAAWGQLADELRTHAAAIERI